ncbi:hypothetical protein [Curtobacterium flaccumfaciens]|uniref:hypothetical protein n=1 Tax=Curtobacterium flaccumfaciens TaxID=2035 RepID=UPI0039927543
MADTSAPAAGAPGDPSESTVGGDSKTSDFIDAFQWRADDNMVALRFRSGLVRGFSGDALNATHAKDFAMVEVHPSRRNVFFKTTITMAQQPLRTPPAGVRERSAMPLAARKHGIHPTQQNASAAICWREREVAPRRCHWPHGYRRDAG